jgi:hypothetical protein
VWSAALLNSMLGFTNPVVQFRKPFAALYSGANAPGRGIAVTLSELPTYRIDRVDVQQDSWLLKGELSHRKTVRNGRSWLYLAPETFLIGDLEGVIDVSLTGEFRTPPKDFEPGRLVDQKPYWMNAYWNARFIISIADVRHIWERIVFKGMDAFEKYENGLRNLAQRRRTNQRSG